MITVEITPATLKAARPHVVWLFTVHDDETFITSGSTYRRSVWNLFEYLTHLIRWHTASEDDDDDDE